MVKKNTNLTSHQVIEIIIKRYEGLVPQNTWGETSLFYNPDKKLTRGTYFVTIKEKDGQNDKASNLDRENVYRLNFGSDKQTFEELFGSRPDRPAKGGIITGNYDFSNLDCLMPHPVYGWIGWLCVLNPSQSTFDSILPLIDKYYQATTQRYEKRMKKTKNIYKF